ncbi:hypothetical protein E5163_04975 [Marinicauda algicola]|uniref:Nuclear transport factor 2 family protein n=1 Tax=Marinicauda algicola TaxID=2029849 RepID=A0A4S2H4D8_9PROT|nr:hypothetical protein [Marinicauda algicola]TGY90474.1 hypothetical protein E5163_04975 [Marinicauda algicola]
MLRSAVFAACLAALPVSAVHAQETIDETMEALYASISGPVGAPRDFDMLRSLFLEGAVMGFVAPGEEGEVRARTFTVEGYIENNADRLVEVGFVETETRRQTWVYGELATVYSAYEGLRSDTGETIVSGINVLTLLETDEGWKIASILWRPADAEWPVERGFGE